MTNERAIELLNRISDSQFDGIHGDERREALEMAVRALSCEGDTISRQAAIDAFWKLEAELRPSAIDAVLNMLKCLPSAQPETHDKRTETHACDLISREMAIDAVAKWFYDVFGIKESDGTATIFKRLRELPSAQPHWIPCSERLPEDNVPVNITWINRKPEFYYAEIKDVPFTATGVYFKGKWYWYSSTVEDYLAEYGRAEWDEIEEAMHNSIEVVAWMPLPEPYGGESDE